jgi:hypothetical protein
MPNDENPMTSFPDRVLVWGAVTTFKTIPTIGAIHEAFANCAPKLSFPGSKGGAGSGGGCGGIDMADIPSLFE